MDPSGGSHVFFSQSLNAAAGSSVAFVGLRMACFDRPMDPFEPSSAAPATETRHARTPIRGYVFAIVAWVCIAGLITNDPWSIRDGVWLEHLTFAFAWLLGVVSCAVMSIVTPAESSRPRIIAVAALAILLFLPVTYRLLYRVVTQLIPIAYGQ